jgi:hypothetical protein
MPNKVREFKQPSNRSAKRLADRPMILFKLGEQRFLIQWIVTVLKAEPAEVIPLRKKRRSR